MRFESQPYENSLKTPECLPKMLDNIENNKAHFSVCNEHSENRNEHNHFSVNDRLTNESIQHKQEQILHKTIGTHPIMSNTRAQNWTADWTYRYTQLTEFKTQEGHCDVPFRFKENLSLGIWVINQRKAYHHYMNGQPSHLTQMRIEKLEEIGFKWRVQKAQNENWRKQYMKMKQFKHVHNHCNVPQHYTDDESLGMWTSQQRQQYKKFKDGKKTNMTEFRISELEKIGFKWNVKKGNISSWMMHYEELNTFQACKGHCIVPKKHDSNPSLRKWVEVQRNEYSKLKQKKKSLMTQEKLSF